MTKKRHKSLVLWSSISEKVVNIGAILKQSGKSRAAWHSEMHLPGESTPGARHLEVASAGARCNFYWYLITILLLLNYYYLVCYFIIIKLYYLILLLNCYYNNKHLCTVCYVPATVLTIFMYVRAQVIPQTTLSCNYYYLQCKWGKLRHRKIRTLPPDHTPLRDRSSCFFQIQIKGKMSCQYTVCGKGSIC